MLKNARTAMSVRKRCMTAYKGSPSYAKQTLKVRSFIPSQTALQHLLDRHLFSVSFGIAAQYETLGNRYAAIRHYLEALQSIDFLSDSNEKMKNKVVAMDRIAQCYEEL